MYRPRPAHLTLVFLLLAGGCKPPPPSDTAIRSDSAGVLLVEHRHLPPIEASRIAIAAEPDLVLGEGTLAGPDHEFFQIMGVSQLRDGTLVVANQGSHELRFYGADGHFLRSFGREGDGPGEFRYMSDLWNMAGDTLVVWDQVALRLQHVSPDGAFVRSTSLAGATFAEFPSGGLPPRPQAVLENGRVVVFVDSPWTPSDGVPERPPLLVALHGIDEGGWDAVRVVPGTERIFAPVGDGRVSGTAHTFGGYAVAAGAGATAAVADAARFRVELFDPDGRLLSVVSAAVPEVPATADVLEAYIELMLERWPGGIPHDDFPEAVRTGMRARPYAPFLPAIRAVFVDEDERIWVERFDVPGAGPSRWEVFARDGTWLGRVEMPAGFARGIGGGSAPGFSIASGRLAGVWTDPDTGVETVRVYRVIELDS